MAQTFKRTATATFAINGTDQEVTVSNVPYIWIPATNPDMEGEATGLFVQQALEGLPVKVTRLARGIPSGSQLDYADPAIIGDALEGRTQMRDERTSGRSQSREASRDET